MRRRAHLSSLTWLFLLVGMSFVGMGCPQGGDVSSGQNDALETSCQGLCELLSECVSVSEIPEDCSATCASISTIASEEEVECVRENLDCRCVASIEDLADFAATHCTGGTFSTGLSGDLLTLRVMTYNIGNPDADEPHYPLRLSYQDYEDFMGEKIRELQPDVVLLQEVLSNGDTCAAFEETDAERTCFNFGNRLEPVRRLLGDDYSTLCDQNLQTECVGVRNGFGELEGTMETLPLPLPPCHWAARDCGSEKCDRESTVSAVTVTTPQGSFRLVHLHPHAGFFDGILDFDTGGSCRSLQFRQAFEGYEGEGPLIATTTTLIAGDWNVDESFESPAEREVLEAHVGCETRFRYLNPVGEDDSFAPTMRTTAFALDRVAVDEGIGTCTVYGPEEDGSFLEDPLDVAFDFSVLPDGENSEGRIDHFAVVCDITLSPSAD